jgi:hypothetical protein
MSQGRLSVRGDARMNKLELIDIDKTYGKTHVLNKISLKVEG